MTHQGKTWRERPYASFYTHLGDPQDYSFYAYSVQEDKSPLNDKTLEEHSNTYQDFPFGMPT